MRLSSAARSLVLLSALIAGCAAASADKTTISSTDAEQIVDRLFVSTLQAYDAKLHISPATCPSGLNFTAGKIPHCTVKVDGVPVRVGIVYDSSTGQFAIEQSSFFEMDQVERLEKLQLANGYGINADVHCSGPRYRLLPVGTIFTCSVAGSPAITTLRLRAQANGQIFIFNPKGQNSPLWMTNAIDEHKAGRQTVLDGPTVAKWLQQLLGAMAAAKGSQTTFHVQCPPSLDVTGPKRGICHVNFQGYDIRRVVFIDPVKGVDTITLDVPVDLPKLQRAAQDDLNDHLRQDGRPANAAVHCKTGMLIVTPPATFNCDATGGGTAYNVEMTIQDSNGTATWRFVPTDLMPSPTPSGSPGTGKSAHHSA